MSLGGRRLFLPLIFSFTHGPRAGNGIMRRVYRIAASRQHTIFRQINPVLFLEMNVSI